MPRPKDQTSPASARPTAATATGRGCRPVAAERARCLGRGHDLAGAARRQLATQPRQRPTGGGEGVAEQAGRQHPGSQAGGEQRAEGEDERRVDLHVEARAER